jgi:hypothetical protein
MVAVIVAVVATADCEDDWNSHPQAAREHHCQASSHRQLLLVRRVFATLRPAQA